MEMIQEIPLSWDAPHGDLFPDDMDFMEESAFHMIATSEGHDIHLWVAAYQFRQVNVGQYITPYGSKQATTLMVIPSERRGKGLYDNDFVHRGTYLTQHLKPDALLIEKKGDRVIWTIEGRRQILRPPVWEVKGIHAGVEVDLTFRRLGQPLRCYPPVEKATKDTIYIGYDVFCSVNGSIKVGGKTYPIKNAWGIREHATGTQYDWMSVSPSYWVNVVTENILLHMWQMQAGRTTCNATVEIEGKQILYAPLSGQGSIKLTTLDYWNDPRNGLCQPSRWHLALASSEGMADLEFAAYGRTNNAWITKKGVALEQWQLSIATGAFYLPGGRTFQVKDALAMVNPTRRILLSEEPLPDPGPQGAINARL